MVMDYIRSCYRRKARIFRDSDEEVTLRWYPAPPGASLFPLASKFGSRDWHDKVDPFPRLGEIQEAKRHWSKSDHSLAYLGKCYVGEDRWWTDGVPLAALGSIAALPPCCTPIPVYGGPLFGGSGLVTSGNSIKVGALRFGGSGAVTSGNLKFPGGGVRYGGAALVLAGHGGLGYLWGGLGLGGLLLGGWAPPSPTGLSFGGSVDADTEPDNQGQGGWQLGGDGRYATAADNDREGGVAWGGAATVTRYDPNSVQTPACSNRINYGLTAVFDQCTGGLASLAGTYHFAHISGNLWSVGTPNLGNGTVRWQLDFGFYNWSQVQLSCNCLYIGQMVPVSGSCSPFRLEYFGNIPASAMLCGIPKLNGAFHLVVTPLQP